VVDHETLRRWRLAEGEHKVRRRKQQHRQWRERKPSFGAMLQLDGSHHDWFEGRGPQCVLMVMGTTRATRCGRGSSRRRRRGPATMCWKAGCASMDCGQPVCGSDSIYRCEGWRALPSNCRESAADAVWAGDGAVGGGIDPGQNSPQAKGRVERMNGTLQDRLVKEMRFGRDQRHGPVRTVFWTGVSAWISTGSLHERQPVPWTCIGPCRGNLNEVFELGGRARGAKTTGRWRVKGSGISWTGNTRR